MIASVIQYGIIFSKTIFSITEQLAIIKDGREEKSKEERKRGIKKIEYKDSKEI